MPVIWNIFYYNFPFGYGGPNIQISNIHFFQVIDPFKDSHELARQESDRHGNFLPESILTFLMTHNWNETEWRHSPCVFAGYSPSLSDG